MGGGAWPGYDRVVLMKPKAINNLSWYFDPGPTPRPKYPGHWRLRPAVGGFVAAVLLGGLGMLLTGVGVAAAAVCEWPVLARGTVERAGEGGDLVLEDGRVVRLAALAADFPDEGHAEALRTALNEIAVGAEVEIRAPGPGTDRYGRLAGLVSLLPPDVGSTVQDMLVDLGLAVVRPEPGYAPCLQGLMAVEDGARASRRGLWARFPLRAEDVEAVRASNGRFGVIEGRIFAVGTGRNIDYLNFGRVWRQDVTIRIPGQARPRFVGAGLNPERLANRTVLARGVVFEAGGPAIEVELPEQIKVEGDE